MLWNFTHPMIFKVRFFDITFNDKNTLCNLSDCILMSVSKLNIWRSQEKISRKLSFNIVISHLNCKLSQQICDIQNSSIHLKELQINKKSYVIAKMSITNNLIWYLSWYIMCCLNKSLGLVMMQIFFHDFFMGPPISTLFSSTDLIILCCPIFEKNKKNPLKECCCPQTKFWDTWTPSQSQLMGYL